MHQGAGRNAVCEVQSALIHKGTGWELAVGPWGAGNLGGLRSWDSRKYAVELGLMHQSISPT